MSLISLIAIVVIGYFVVNLVKDYNGRQQQDSRQLEALQQEVADLKQRVITLEAIVVDKDEALKQKFRDL
ncbi:hypothetical protein KDN34_03595 [Shewanella yunxiaonensis]|uniref:Phage shock protein B n=1 Tax=Shewanella yunxiaonensis TaxID=2829809 RepID=A0ABX7YV49_9GAMM|nr:hypothetical protein [Shewanella yunxiaonensis]QUN06554.1 hypothetical protein KDN34_03595 [Shewanella yunxiaonensis]